MKIKHSVSSPPKEIWEEFFLLKKLFLVEQTFLGKFMGGLFYMGSNDQIMQGGGNTSQIHFPVIWTMQIWKFSPAMVGDSLENKS